MWVFLACFKLHVSKLRNVQYSCKSFFGFFFIFHWFAFWHKMPINYDDFWMFYILKCKLIIKKGDYEKSNVKSVV